MKKFFLMLMMSLVMVTMTSAQTVHEGKFFDNTYVTVSVGAYNATTNIQVGESCFYKYIRPQFGVEVGKQLTTLYTTGLEFTTAVNTVGVHTAFDEISLLWIHKLNLSNIAFKYNPDTKWDLNVVGGLGWGHTMCIRDNYGIVQAGIEVAYNLNNTWSILAKPNIEWNHTESGFTIDDSNVGISIGVSYKFPNRDGSRGFTICNGDKLHMECNRLNAEINDLRQQLDGQKAINNNLNAKLKLHEQHQCQVDTVIIDNTITPTLGFVINKAELTEQSNAYLYQIAQAYKNSELVVKGYADAQTGNPEYNMELSKKRAEVVKAKLIEYGATNVVIEAYGDTVQPFADNDMNRVAIVVKK